MHLSSYLAKFTSASTSRTKSASLAQRLLLGSLLFVMASGGLWLTAFSAQHQLHNAAHDVRHGLNFPCH